MRVALLGIALAACSPDVGPRSVMDYTQAAAAREACMFTAGTLPGLSIAHDAPLGQQLPIDTFVIIMMENRSVDHVLGGLQALQPDADIASPDATNPDNDAAGTPIQRYHMTEMCFDDP